MNDLFHFVILTTAGKIDTIPYVKRRHPLCCNICGNDEPKADIYVDPDLDYSHSEGGVFHAKCLGRFDVMAIIANGPYALHEILTKDFYFSRCYKINYEYEETVSPQAEPDEDGFWRGTPPKLKLEFEAWAAQKSDFTRGWYHGGILI